MDYLPPNQNAHQCIQILICFLQYDSTGPILPFLFQWNYKVKGEKLPVILNDVDLVMGFISNSC